MADSQSTGRFTARQIARFWKHVDKTSDCWLWTHRRTNDGYGYFPLMIHGERIQRAHRFAWELANGVTVPSGLLVCHRCDVRLCVNPAHLYLGTNKDNTRDARTRRRFPASHRTHCPHGHEYTPENTMWRPYTRNGGKWQGVQRRCRTCTRVTQRIWEQRCRKNRKR